MRIDIHIPNSFFSITQSIPRKVITASEHDLISTNSITSQVLIPYKGTDLSTTISQGTSEITGTNSQ